MYALRGEFLFTLLLVIIYFFLVNNNKKKPILVQAIKYTTIIV